MPLLLGESRILVGRKPLDIAQVADTVCHIVLLAETGLPRVRHTAAGAKKSLSFTARSTDRHRIERRDGWGTIDRNRHAAHSRLRRNVAAVPWRLVLRHIPAR